MVLKKYQNIWIAIGIALSAFLFWYFRIILLYLFFAMCLTFVLTPLVNYFSRGKVFKIRVPRILSTILAFIILIGVISVFSMTLFPLITTEIDHLKNIDPNKLTNVFDNQIYYIEHLLIKNGISDQQPGYLKPMIIQEVTGLLNKQNAESVLTNVFSGIASLVIAIFSIFFISFFSLKDENLLKKSIASIIPGKYYVDYIAVFNNIEKLLSRYFIGLLIQASVISFIVSVSLYFVGVQNFLLIGILVGLINVIPYLGQVIAVFVALFLGVASNVDIINSSELLMFLLSISGIVIITQTLDSFVFQPLIFSKSVKAHPLEIFLMVFVGGTIGGAFGMFLAIPVYTIVKVSFRGFYGVYLKKLKESNKGNGN